MKKITLTLVLLLSLLSNTIQPLPNVEVCKDFTQKIEADAELEDLFKKHKHNPHIKLIKKNNPNVIKQGGPLLLFHGWQGSPDSPNTHYQSINSESLPGDVVTFAFKDASWWIKNIFFYGMSISQSNFGSYDDVKTALITLKALQNTNTLPSGFYAHSRGAKVAHDTLCILSNPTLPEHKILLDTCGLTSQDCQKILNELKTVYLITPLVNFKSSALRQVSVKLDNMFIGKFLSDEQKNNIATSLRKNVLPKLTQYDENNYQNVTDYIKKSNP
jgi:hypothetical protein